MDANSFLTEIVPIKNKELKRILEQECRIDTYSQGGSLLMK